mgnify:FL=1
MKTNQKIPEGWSVKKLGEICKNKGLYGANAPSVPYSPNLPLYIRITDIDDDGKYIFSNRVSVNISDYKNYLLEKGDIVFARTGATTGKTYLYNENDGQFVFAGFLIKFSPNTNLINPYYLKLSTEMPFYKSWIKVMSVRSGQPGVNAEEYAKYPLLLPPLPEQEKIAEILGAWDLAIEKVTALIAAKRLRKKGLMQKLLTAKIRLPGFTDEWQKVKLGEIASIVKGEQLGRLEMTESGIYPVINGGILKSGFTDSYNREKNTITISEGGNSCGFVAFVKERFWCGGHCYALSNLKTDLHFLFQILKFSESNIMRLRVGSGLPNIQKSSLDNFLLHIPTDVSEQKAIADILSKADEEIDLLVRKLDLLKSQKKGLMQQLLTGKIRVKVA